MSFDLLSARSSCLRDIAERTYLGNTSTLLKAQLIRLVNEHMRAHNNVLCISTTVCQTKNSIALLETTLTLRSQLLNYTAEFDTEGLGSLRRDWVVSFTLKEVHAVETEGLDADKSLSGGGLGTFNLVDEEGGGRAFAILDICISRELDNFERASVKLQTSAEIRTDSTHGNHCD